MSRTGSRSPVGGSQPRPGERANPAPDGTPLYEPLFLSHFVDQKLSDDIRRIPGVGNLNIIGERRYALRIWLDGQRLASFDLTPLDVERPRAARFTSSALTAMGRAIGRPSAGRGAGSQDGCDPVELS